MIDLMLGCIILGDSIGVGISNVRKECVSYAKSGINSKNWNLKYASKRLDANTVVISLGSNDYKGLDTAKELLKLRKRVNAKRVYWIVPAGVGSKAGISVQSIQKTVNAIAHKYGDTAVTIPNVSSDRIHPTGKGYRTMGAITK